MRVGDVIYMHVMRDIYMHAGKESMVNEVEREAMELAFNVGGEDMEQIFNKQKLSYFVPQQQSQQQGQQRRDQPLASILDFAGFF